MLVDDAIMRRNETQRYLNKFLRRESVRFSSGAFSQGEDV